MVDISFVSYVFMVVRLGRTVTASVEFFLSTWFLVPMAPGRLALGAWHLVNRPTTTDVGGE